MVQAEVGVTPRREAISPWRLSLTWDGVNQQGVGEHGVTTLQTGDIRITTGGRINTIVRQRFFTHSMLTPLLEVFNVPAW